MKKSNTSTEIPVSKTKVEQAAIKPEAKAKTKVEAKTETKIEQPVPAVAKATKAAPKKSSPDLKTTKKAPAEAAKKEVAQPEIPVLDRVGLTAGSIWQYLTENGATSIAKLVRELPEEEKIIQRSIGWLAQEDKISFYIADRVETVELK